MQDRWFEEEFWPNCWRKVDKADAKKAFKKHATSEVLEDQIVAAAKAHAPYYLSRDPEHRPHAATWLSKRRYEEPPEDSRPAAPESARLNGRPAVSEYQSAEEYLRITDSE